MDNLKHFLDSVCSDSEYTYEQVDNLAEIYEGESDNPIAIVEWNRSFGSMMVRFRIGVSSHQIASLSRDMAIQDGSLIFQEDFIIDPDYGYLYGEEATQAFVSMLQNKVQDASEDAMEGAIFVSSEPIFAYGSGYEGKTDIEKMWGDEI